MQRKVINGEIKSLFRSKDEILKTKVSKGGLSASSWYLKGKTERVMYCQPTPGGKLASKIKVALREVSKGPKN